MGSNQVTRAPVLIDDFGSSTQVWEFANRKYAEGYRVVSLSTYVCNGARYVICMQLKETSHEQAV